jgi:ferrochelatase
MSGSPLAVVLLNMGGPESLSEVWPFLYRLFRDPDILPLPRPLRFFSAPLSLLIATMRAKKSKEGYARIGGGSPQRRTSEEVARKLETLLNEKGIFSRVRLAMRYWKPFTEEALSEIQKEGCEPILLLPLYPHYSTTTTMSSYREFFRVYRRLGLKAPVYPILRYSRDPRYLDLIVKRLDTILPKVQSPPERTAILFSAHSIPWDRVEDLGDPYPEEITGMMEDLIARLQGGYRFALGYQSKLGPVRWLEPSTEEVIHRLAEEGMNTIVVVPVSFTSEHIETLDEIAIGYRDLALKLGVREFFCVPTVGSDEDFIHFLSELVEEALEGKILYHHCLRKGAEKDCVCLKGTSQADGSSGGRRISPVIETALS